MSEVNDLGDLPKRIAHASVLDNMQKQQPAPAKPRGNPTAANLQKGANRRQIELIQRDKPDTTVPGPVATIVKDDRFPELSKALGLFLECNLSPDIHKTLVIHVFCQAIFQHGMGIMEASKLSASITGFSEQVIRRWAKEYHSTALLFYVDEVEDELIKEIIFSNQGHHLKSLTLMALQSRSKPGGAMKLLKTQHAGGCTS